MDSKGSYWFHVNTKGPYFANMPIEATFHMKLRKSVRIESLFVQLQCIIFFKNLFLAQKIDFLSTTQKNLAEKTFFYHSSEISASKERVYEKKNYPERYVILKPTDTATQTYSFEVKFLVPGDNHPPSTGFALNSACESEYAVVWRLAAGLVLPKSPTKIPLCYYRIEKLNLYSNEQALAPKIFKAKDVTFLTKTLRLNCFLNLSKQVYYSGEPVRVCLVVTSMDKYKAEEVSASIVQKIYYASDVDGINMDHCYTIARPYMHSRDSAVAPSRASRDMTAYGENTISSSTANSTRDNAAIHSTDAARLAWIAGYLGRNGFELPITDLFKHFSSYFSPQTSDGTAAERFEGNMISEDGSPFLQESASQMESSHMAAVAAAHETNEQPVLRVEPERTRSPVNNGHLDVKSLKKAYIPSTDATFTLKTLSGCFTGTDSPTAPNSAAHHQSPPSPYSAPSSPLLQETPPEKRRASDFNCQYEGAGVRGMVAPSHGGGSRRSGSNTSVAGNSRWLGASYGYAPPVVTNLLAVGGRHRSGTATTTATTTSSSGYPTCVMEATASEVNSGASRYRVYENVLPGTTSKSLIAIDDGVFGVQFMVLPQVNCGCDCQDEPAHAKKFRCGKCVLCEHCAHNPVPGEDNQFSLTPTTSILTETLGCFRVVYCVRVKISLSWYKSVSLDIPFTLSNAKSAQAVSAMMRQTEAMGELDLFETHLCDSVSRLPWFEDPPSYDRLHTDSLGGIKTPSS